MDGHLFNPDDSKQPKTFGLNILIFNFLGLYIEYIFTVNFSKKLKEQQGRKRPGPVDNAYA